MSDTVSAVSAVSATDAAKPTGVRWKIFLLMLFLISINYIVSDLLTAPCGDIDESADVDRFDGIGSHIWSTIYLTLRGHVAE
jgi:hypothetical protein